MAAKNTSVDLDADEWTLISDSGTDITTATWFNKSTQTVVEFLGVAGEVTPTPSTDGASIPYPPGQGEDDRTLSTIWLGITPTRLYARALGYKAKIVITHAAGIAAVLYGADYSTSINSLNAIGGGLI